MLNYQFKNTKRKQNINKCFKNTFGKLMIFYYLKSIMQIEELKCDVY